ncbi:aminomethyl transferase family protein [Lactococcus garvieae subsp. garvieae]|uniref:aminomethyltransferase family protein n=2 Tax=Lactococcus garvieae TaxID=1363 RepID=UPI0005A686C9|nr:aminomethyltransferase family protein [Lactococcus garvieae]KAA8710676.1 aminomethyl transferase family protein [Lactococcus garvieae subsp. garvieae]MDG6192263.1 aminomethyltransferase family protein [Lactococcus garvieae]PCR99397.1 cylF protein [Lactococcus garvieae]QPR49406.1 aminomethyltransferase family protein [Lactococcus garvieae]
MDNKNYTDFRKNKSWKTFDGNIFEITGDRAEEILEYYIPKILEFIDIDTSGYSFILNEDGQVFDEVFFYKLEDKYLLFSEGDLLSLFTNSEGFEIKEISQEKTLIQIEGKNSGEIAQHFYNYDISTLNFRAIILSQFENSEIILSRFGFSGEFGYQFLINSDNLEEFIKIHLKGVKQFDKELEDYVKFEVNHPLSNIFKSRNNLFELGYSWNLDFTKEDFRGKKALLNKIDNSTMQSIAFSSANKVCENDIVYFDKQQIGKIHYVKENIDGKADRNYIGLLFVDSYYAHSGIHLCTENGTELTTLSNPYVIPESW